MVGNIQEGKNAGKAVCGTFLLKLTLTVCLYSLCVVSYLPFNSSHLSLSFSVFSKEAEEEVIGSVVPLVCEGLCKNHAMALRVYS